MISERVNRYVNDMEPYLTPDSGNFDAVRPALTALLLPYDLEDWRAHHDMSHLEEQFGFLKEYDYLLQSPRTVFMAQVAHDTSYQPWLYDPALGVKGVNEKQSKYLMQQLLTPHYQSHEIAKASTLIDATAEHPIDVGDPDTQLFLDSDMMVIGLSEERTEAWDQNILREYTYKNRISKRDFMLGRRAFLLHTLQKDRIFCTEVAQDLFEAPARLNLARLALRYEKELETS